VREAVEVGRYGLLSRGANRDIFSTLDVEETDAMSHLKLRISAAPAVVIALGLLGLGAAPVRHLALQSSLPAADAVVQSPTLIQLDFTEAPQSGTTSIRLVDAGGNLLVTGEVTQSAQDPTVFTTSVDRSLNAGVYSVAWRAMANDGHVLTEDFAFTVRAAE
jgi:methionine-rich copper-binding protein CopC